MGHTQLGLAHRGDACEIAWNQGLDLYRYADNRLRRGFEYTARYNLGEDVPFTERCWLRLERRGARITAAISTDGQSWTAVGATSVDLQSDVFAGLAATSRLSSVTTTVTFDHVTVLPLSL